MLVGAPEAPHPVQEFVPLGDLVLDLLLERPGRRRRLGWRLTAALLGKDLLGRLAVELVAERELILARIGGLCRPAWWRHRPLEVVVRVPYLLLGAPVRQALDRGWPLAVHALTHLGHAHGALRNRRVAGRRFLGELVLLQRVERHKAHRGGLFGARLELDLIRFRVLVANALAGVFAIEPRHRAQHRSFLLVHKSAPQRWRVALLRQLVSHGRRGAQSRASGRRRTRRRRRVLRAAAHQRLEARVRRHPSRLVVQIGREDDRL